MTDDELVELYHPDLPEGQTYRTTSAAVAIHERSGWRRLPVEAPDQASGDDGGDESHEQENEA